MKRKNKETFIKNVIVKYLNQHIEKNICNCFIRICIMRRIVDLDKYCNFFLTLLLTQIYNLLQESSCI